MNDNMKVLNSNKGQLINTVLGSDTNAQAFIVNEQEFNKQKQREQSSKLEQDIADLNEKYEQRVKQLEEESQQIKADFNKLEIMPLTSYVLIKPFSGNPFQKKASNLITGTELAPIYKSQETGDMLEANQYIKVGLVTEVGAECKFLKPGDVVFYNIASEVQVPFFKFGFVIVAEQRILAVVNEGLTDRKLDAQSKTTKD